MSNTNLLIKLRELHQELATINDDLAKSEQIDEKTVDVLGQLMSDISSIIDRSRVDPDPDPTNNATTSNDLLDQIREFEVDHPRVTRFLSQLTDMLAMIGI